MPEPTAPKHPGMAEQPLGSKSDQPDLRANLTDRRGEPMPGSGATDAGEGGGNWTAADDSALSTTMFALFVASIIMFGTAADQCSDNDNCDDSREAWAIAVGVISAAFAFVWLFFRHLAKLPFPPIVELAVALVLVILWGFGVGFSTGLGGPFDANNNGYFASWAALILSVIYLAYAWALLGRSNYYLTHFHHALLLLLFASLVVMAVSANFCNTDDVECKKRLAWGVAVGAISTFLCLLQMALSHFAYNVAQATGRLLGLLLLLLWIFGAAFLTSISGTYPSPCVNANGYYATWLAFGASVVYFWQVVIQNVPEEEV